MYGHDITRIIDTMDSWASYRLAMKIARIVETTTARMAKYKFHVVLNGVLLGGSDDRNSADRKAASMGGAVMERDIGNPLLAHAARVARLHRMRQQVKTVTKVMNGIKPDLKSGDE